MPVDQLIAFLFAFAATCAVIAWAIHLVSR